MNPSVPSQPASFLARILFLAQALASLFGILMFWTGYANFDSGSSSTAAVSVKACEEIVDEEDDTFFETELALPALEQTDEPLSPRSILAISVSGSSSAAVPLQVCEEIVEEEDDTFFEMDKEPEVRFCAKPLSSRRSILRQLAPVLRLGKKPPLQMRSSAEAKQKTVTMKPKMVVVLKRIGNNEDFEKPSGRFSKGWIQKCLNLIKKPLQGGGCLQPKKRMREKANSSCCSPWQNLWKSRHGSQNYVRSIKLGSSTVKITAVSKPKNQDSKEQQQDKKAGPSTLRSLLQNYNSDEDEE